MNLLGCPRCNDRLIPRAEGGLSAHLCPTCGGVFLDSTLVPQLDASMVAGALRRLAADAARRAPFGASLGLGPVACPVCRAPMAQRQHYRVPVPVDVCLAHGVWFDRGELQRITERIPLSPYRSSGAPEAKPAPTRPAVLELPPLDPDYVMPPTPPPPKSSTGSALLDLLATLADFN